MSRRPEASRASRLRASEAAGVRGRAKGLGCHCTSTGAPPVQGYDLFILLSTEDELEAAAHPGASCRKGPPAGSSSHTLHKPSPTCTFVTLDWKSCLSYYLFSVLAILIHAVLFPDAIHATYTVVPVSAALSMVTYFSPHISCRSSCYFFVKAC